MSAPLKPVSSRDYGYSAAEIGRHLAVHSSTVSKVVNAPSHRVILDSRLDPLRDLI